MVEERIKRLTLTSWLTVQHLGLSVKLFYKELASLRAKFQAEGLFHNID